MDSQRKIASHWVLTPQGLLSNQIVSINSQGVITSVEPCDRLDSVANLEFYAGVLIPGMVNAHCHLELSYLRGCIEQRTGFAGFAKSLSEHRAKFTLDQRLRAANYYDAKMYSEGVSVVCDVCNGDTTLDVKARSEIKYIDFVELFGLNSKVSDIEPLLEEHKARGLAHNLTTHSCYSLNTQAFGDVISKSDSRMPLSIHFMETDSEWQLFLGEGELNEWYEQRGFTPDFLAEQSPTDRLINNISAKRKLLLVHNTVLSSVDTERLISHFGDNLCFVLCPNSNAYISGLTPDAKMLETLGARICVGTDSLSSNTDLSLIAELRSLQELGFSLEELLRMVSYNAYEFLGMDDMGIKEGSQASLVLLEGCDLKNMSLGENTTTRRLI